MKVPEDYVFVCFVDGTKIMVRDITQIRVWNDGSCTVVHYSRSAVVGSLGITLDDDTTFWRDDRRFPEMLSKAFALDIMQ